MISPATPTELLSLEQRIAEKVAGFCGLPATDPDVTDLERLERYTAAVIALVRESIARDIEAERLTPVGAAAQAVWATGYTDGLNAAARIARGAS